MVKTLQIREHEGIENMLELCSAAGFTEVAIGFGDSVEFFSEGFEKRTEDIGVLLERYKIKCVQTHLPFYHLLVSCEEKNEAVENAIKRCLVASSTLGAKWSAFHPRSAVSSGFDRAIGFKDNRDMLLSYLEVAEKCGCGIAVENMPLYPRSNPEWRFFGGGYEEICELCDSIDSDKIGICWDFGHAHISALDQRAGLLRVGKKLKLTHIHDNYRNGDQHLVPLTGSAEWGCIKWEELMPVLSEICYDGPLTLEVITPPEKMRKSFVYHCLDSLCCLESCMNG